MREFIILLLFGLSLTLLGLLDERSTDLLQQYAIQHRLNEDGTSIYSYPKSFLLLQLIFGSSACLIGYRNIHSFRKFFSMSKRTASEDHYEGLFILGIILIIFSPYWYHNITIDKEQVIIRSVFSRQIIRFTELKSLQYQQSKTSSERIVYTFNDGNSIRYTADPLKQLALDEILMRASAHNVQISIIQLTY